MTEIRREIIERDTNTDGDNVTRQVVREDERPGPSTVAERLIEIVGGALLLLLVARFLLLMFGASRASGFVDLIYGLSGPFVAPFNGIFSEPTYGSSHFDSATLVAIFVYAIIMVGLMKLVTMGSRHYRGHT